MKTSNYARCAKHPNAVSIAGRAPDWYEGRQYKILAPKKDFFLEYKRTGDEAAYIEEFQRRVLDPLDPRQIYEELGPNAILLCWEAPGPGQFCHRWLVARWLEKHLGITIPEVGMEQTQGALL